MGRQTGFGEMATAQAGDVEVEAMIFREAGSKHTHDLYEHAYCINGGGWVEVGGERHQVSAGDVLTVPPNTPHRMIPGEGEKAYKFAIFYSPHGHLEIADPATERERDADD